MNYVNELEDTLESIQNNFVKYGFTKINNIFSKEFVSYIKEKIDKSINAPIDKYQSGFNRIAFDLFVDDEIILGLMEDNKFRKIMTAITSENLFFTQALAFELKKNVSSGFPWHIGTQSFGYQQASDFGCTIWMPLDEINTKIQRGGMAYVPENIISGKFMYDYADPSIAQHIKERHDNEDNPKVEDYLKLRDGILNDGSMKTLLDHFSVEDDFSIGDILVFNKNVIHSSVKLGDGNLEKRGAFVMRFIDYNSTYDKERALSLDYPRKIFNYTGCTTFHLDVCKDDGELISKSNFFSNSDSRALYQQQRK